MNLIGRYERLRGIGPQGVTLPYILDRKWSRLCAFDCDEWWRAPDGVWIPTVAGGVGYAGKVGGMALQGIGNFNYGGSWTGFNLNSAYNAGVSGAAYAARYVCFGSETLTSIYFYITSYTNTATTINYEVRTSSSSLTPDMAGGALLTSGSVNTSAATGWIKITLSQALSAGFNWIIIGDADSDGSNYAVVSQRIGGNVSTLNAVFQVYETSVGFSTQATNRFSTPMMVLGFASGRAVGFPFSARAVGASDTYRKGIYVSGFTASHKLYGMLVNSGSEKTNGLEFYAAAANPGGSTLGTGSVVIGGGTGNAVYGILMGTPVTIAASTAFRAVFTGSAAFNTPYDYAIGTGADATLKAAMLGGGSWYSSREKTGSAWDDDAALPSKFPDVILLVEDQVAAATGGAPHLTGYGLAGG